jgi:two-component system, OmpR family, sensor histidine kinase BaeS
LHDDVLRLTQVLDDLEALASADAAGLSLQTRVVDLAAVTRDAAERLAGQYETAEVDLTVQVNQALVRADPLRLGQVVTNLLTNALKFTPAGGSVTIAVEEDGRSVRLEVTDTGVGIPLDEQGHIFDRFWRGASAHSVAGSGIGLTVVAELVRAHGGHIQVRSRPGDGTRMTVTLPAAGTGSPSILHIDSISTAPAADAMNATKAPDDDTRARDRRFHARRPPG